MNTAALGLGVMDVTWAFAEMPKGNHDKVCQKLFVKHDVVGDDPAKVVSGQAATEELLGLKRHDTP